MFPISSVIIYVFGAALDKNFSGSAHKPQLNLFFSSRGLCTAEPRAGPISLTPAALSVLHQSEDSLGAWKMRLDYVSEAKVSASRQVSGHDTVRSYSPEHLFPSSKLNKIRSNPSRISTYHPSVRFLCSFLPRLIV